MNLADELIILLIFAEGLKAL